MKITNGILSSALYALCAVSNVAVVVNGRLLGALMEDGLNGDAVDVSRELAGEQMCCPSMMSGSRPIADCSGFYGCWKGVVNPTIFTCAPTTIMVEATQRCEFENTTPDFFQCLPATCDADLDRCCAPGFSGKRAYNGCTHYYTCENGVSLEDVTRCDAGTLFDEQSQTCIANLSTCAADDCTAINALSSEPTNSPTDAPSKMPTPAPSSNPTGQPTAGDTESPTTELLCCPPTGTFFKQYNNCDGIYQCTEGVPGPSTFCASGTTFDSTLGNDGGGCNLDSSLPTNYVCPAQDCFHTGVPTSAPTATISEPPTSAPTITPIDVSTAACCTPNLGAIHNFALTSDCTTFYKCHNDGRVAEAFRCASGTLFDSELAQCIFADQASCNLNC